MFIRAVSKHAKENGIACIHWKYDESYLLPSQIDIEAFIAEPDSCRPLKNMFALTGINNIEQEMRTAQRKPPHGMRNLLNRVAEAASEHIKSVWQEHKNISVTLSVNGPHIDTAVVDYFNHFPFASRSDGFKRFVSFLLIISAQVRKNKLTNFLYLHDEPDNGIHPSGAKYLRDELIKISEESYVVFSTHSIFMIDKERIDRHYIVKKINENTQIEEASNSNFIDEEVLYNAVGYSIYETLKSTNIIFEGWRDKALFRTALNSISDGSSKKKKEKLSEFGFCHAKGVKDIKNISAILEIAGKRWIVVSDGDAPAREQQNANLQHMRWYRYDELDGTSITAEDFIKKSRLANTLNSARKETPGLKEIDEAFFSDFNRIEDIKKWLRDANVNVDNQKLIINSIKENIFNNLKSDDIEDNYKINIIPKILEKLAELTPPTKELDQ